MYPYIYLAVDSFEWIVYFRSNCQHRLAWLCYNYNNDNDNNNSGFEKRFETKLEFLEQYRARPDIPRHS